MKIMIWVRTDIINSTVRQTVDIDDEEFEDLNNEEIDNRIDQIVEEDYLPDLINWGWTKVI